MSVTASSLLEATILASRDTKPGKVTRMLFAEGGTTLVAVRM